MHVRIVSPRRRPRQQRVARAVSSRSTPPRGARRGGGFACTETAQGSTPWRSTTQVGFWEERRLQIDKAGSDSPTICERRVPHIDANGVRTPGVSRRRTEFESSTLLPGPVDYWLDRHPLTVEDRDRYSAGSPCRMGLIGYGRRSFTAENRVRAPDATRLVPPVDRASTLRTSSAKVRFLPGSPGRRAREAPAAFIRLTE